MSDATSRWRAAIGACNPALESLMRADDEGGRLAARAAWVRCMGSQVYGCKDSYAHWKAEAAGHGIEGEMKREHTEAAVALPGWAPLAQCVIDHGQQAGVEPTRTLAAVEAAGVQRQAQVELSRAVGEVEPLRNRLQRRFLPHGPAAPGAMGIDELRVSQVWLYGLASRLSSCRRLACDFAQTAGMRDPSAPLVGYDEERWDPGAESWQGMERCVQAHAARAGVEWDTIWRGGR
jgi:hypothetical protein